LYEKHKEVVCQFVPDELDLINKQSTGIETLSVSIFI